MTDFPAPPGDPLPGEASPEVSAALVRMAGLVLSRETVETALALVTEIAATTTPGTVGAGVTLVDGRGRHSRAASDQVVEHADGLQYGLDEGPCLTAWRSRRPVRIDDTATDPRWPRWSAAVVPLGVRSVLSAPLEVGDECIGALKVYSDRPAAYGERDERAVHLFAEQAAILLANTQSLQEARRISRQLTEALTGRDLVMRATGALLARGAPDDSAAFLVLTDAAARSGRTVQEVARDLLAAVAAGNAHPPAG